MEREKGGGKEKGKERVRESGSEGEKRERKEREAGGTINLSASDNKVSRNINMLYLSIV